MKEVTLKDHLQAMLKIDPKLYEQILDTPNFAFHFNEICNMARQSPNEKKAADGEGVK